MSKKNDIAASGRADRKPSEWQWRIVELDEPIEPDFDLEDWLADFLVDHWLSQRGEGGE